MGYDDEGELEWEDGPFDREDETEDMEDRPVKKKKTTKAETSTKGVFNAAPKPKKQPKEPVAQRITSFLSNFCSSPFLTFLQKTLLQQILKVLNPLFLHPLF